MSEVLTRAVRHLCETHPGVVVDPKSVVFGVPGCSRETAIRAIKQVCTEDRWVPEVGVRNGFRRLTMGQRAAAQEGRRIVARLADGGLEDGAVCPAGSRVTVTLTLHQAGLLADALDEGLDLGKRTE